MVNGGRPGNRRNYSGAAMPSPRQDEGLRPEIGPVVGARPLWSVMIPAYNCGRFLGETLESVLRQDPGPDEMQIEVVDDHSTADDPEAVARAVGGERVSVFRQPVNVGNARNFNTCLRRSRGHLVHILHGDDAVRESFYGTLGTAFATHANVGAAFCRYISIDEKSNWQTISPLERPTPGPIDGWLEKIALGQRLQPPCMVVRREVYEHVGGFDENLSYGEDWAMWTRIAAKYPVWYEPAPLALYRVHGGSVTASMRGGRWIDHSRRVIELNATLLPEPRRPAFVADSRRILAATILRRAERILGAGDRPAVTTYVLEALRTSRDLGVLTQAVYLAARWVRHVAGTARRQT